MLLLYQVLLAKFMLHEADLIILDEPTNDLDIDTLEILERALSEFSGAVLLVSHDRALLDSVTTSIIGLDGQGSVYYVASTNQWQEILEALELEKKTINKEEIKKVENKSAKKRPEKLTWKEERELEHMDIDIMEAENHMQNIEKQLLNPLEVASTKELGELGEKFVKAQEKVKLLYDRWEELEKKRLT
jgi:ABC transport system ATP-binding/permease protein